MIIKSVSHVLWQIHHSWTNHFQVSHEIHPKKLTLRCIFFCSSCIPPVLPNFTSHFVPPVFLLPEIVCHFVSPLLDDAENNNRICWVSVRCWLNASNLGSEQESRASAYVLLFPVDSVDYELVFFFSVVWIKTKTDSVPFSKAGGSFGRAWQIFCKDPTLKICWNTSVLHCQHRYNLSKDNHFVWANWHYLSVPIVLIRTLGIFLLCRRYGSRCPKY